MAANEVHGPPRIMPDLEIFVGGSPRACAFACGGSDKDLNRDIALKVIRKEYLDRDEVVQRFGEEAHMGDQL